MDAKDAKELVSLVEVIDDKDAQIALIQARATAVKKPYAELMLQMMSLPGDPAKADEEALLNAIREWPSEYYPRRGSNSRVEEQSEYPRRGSAPRSLLATCPALSD